MSSIWLRDSCRLKGYSASTKGDKSVVKIEIEVTGGHELGFFLQELADAQAAQNIKPAKPLAIEDMRGAPSGGTSGERK